MDPMAGSDPNAAAQMDDPNAMPDADADPMAGGEEMPMTDQEESSDSTMDIINQLNPTDREAVRAYAESMLSRDETQMGAEDGMPEDQGTPEGPAPMMEITKGRLKKIQKRLNEINEVFGDSLTVGNKDETDRRQKKIIGKNRKNKSPFDSPLD